MQKTWSWPKNTKIPVVFFVCFSAATTIAGLFAARHWPYSERAIRSRLSAAAAAQVSFGHFRNPYWPPGCVAENVIFQRRDSPQPMVTIRLTVTSNLFAFFHHRASLVRAQGMHVWLKHSDFSSWGSSGDQDTTDKFEADDGVLEVAGTLARHSLKFVFRSFSISRLGTSKLIRFAAEFENPLPKGIIRTAGQFGPWNNDHPEQTAVSGSHALENADLGGFDSIAGLISSRGNFQGTFAQLEVRRRNGYPGTHGENTEHALPLETHFNALVDTTKGDVTLQHVRASFGRDEIEAHGTIAREGNGPRAAILDFNCPQGRVEDTFYPFPPASPLTGAVAFQMHLILPAGHESFLKRITLESNFRIQAARFTR